MTAPVEVPEEIRRAVDLCKACSIQGYHIPYINGMSRDPHDNLLSLIAAALVSAKREAIREAVERLPWGNAKTGASFNGWPVSLDDEWVRLGEKYAQSCLVFRPALLAALLPPEAP